MWFVARGQGLCYQYFPSETWEQRWLLTWKSGKADLGFLKPCTKSILISLSISDREVKHYPEVPNSDLCRKKKLTQTALFDSINMRKQQREFSHSTEMQLFLETAKGGYRTLQEVPHNPRADLSYNGTKQTCHQIHSCYLLKGKCRKLGSVERNPWG